MADNNTLGLDFVINDATKPGLNSAWNNVTQMTNKMAKELELDVTVKFPEIAGQIAGFEKQMKDANKQIGKFVFGGQRYDKSKKHLLDDSFIFDYTSKKGKLDYDTIKNDILPKLELIKSGLADGFVKSGDIMGVGAKKEAESLRKLVETLTNVKKAYELVLRTQAKFNTQASTRSADIGKAEKTQTGKIRLADINTSIANAKNLHFEGQSEGDLQKQIKAHQKLNQLYRDRFTITKKAKDLERAQSYQAGVRELEKQLKAQQEAAKHAKNKLEYEKLFGVEAQKSAAKLKPQADILSNLRSLATRYLSVFTVARFGKEIAETTKYFEQQQVALEGILGSASAASDAIGKIKAMALESPLQTKELITDVKQLAAYGIEHEKLLDTTKQLADISIGLGVSMDRLILAYGQVKAASVLRGQELRQFTEAGIPLVQALADKFTELNGRVVTTGEVFKLISQRQVSFEMVASVLADMTKEGGKFYKMQERMTDTLYGQMEKTADMWTLAKNSLGEMMHGPLMAVVKALQLVVKNAKGFLITITAPLIIHSLHRMSGYFGQIQDSVGRIPQIMRRTNALMSMATTSARKWHIAMAGVKVAADAAMGAITLGATILVGVIANAVLKAKEFDEAMVGVSRSFNKDTQNLKKGLDSLMYQLAANTKGTTEFNEALETLKNNYKDFINPAVVDKLIAEQKQVDTTTKSWMDLRNSIRSAIDARQQYEKSKARKKTAGEQIVEDFSGEKSVKALQSYLSGSNFDKSNSRKIGSVSQELAEVLDDVVGEYFDKGLTDKEELKKILIDKAERSGLADISDLLDEYFDVLFTSIFSSRFARKKYEQYLRSDRKIKSSSYYTTDTAFDNARDKIASYAGSGIDKDINNDRAAIVAMTQALSKLKITSDDVNDVNNYNNAINKLNDEVSKNWDYGQTKRIADVFEELRNVVTDNTLLDGIAYIAQQFGSITNQRSGTSEKIANNIQKYLDNSLLSNENKDILAKYIPDDRTLLQKRSDIISKYNENSDFMKSHLKNGVWADEYKRREQENKLLEILFGKDYYDINKSELKSGRSQTEQVPLEVSEFVNNMKTAYEVYKKATSGMGAQMGLGYMKNDPKMQQQFGGFFSDAFDNAFKDEKGDIIRIAGRSVKEIMNKAFIEGGLEDGVLNFEKGMRAVAKALDEYAGNSKYRKQFKNMAKEAIKWADAIAKDNVDAKIMKMNAELQELNRTFEISSKQVELYRSLIHSGTDVSLGGKVGVSQEEAMRPDSARSRDYLMRIVDLYNTKAREYGGKEINLGNVSTLADVAKLINQLSAERDMQSGNFSIKELGNIGQKLIDVLNHHIDVVSKELSAISGNQYTGDTFADTYHNMLKDIGVAFKEMQAANKNPNLENGQYDAEAMLKYSDALKKGADSIYEAFWKAIGGNAGLAKRMNPFTGIDMKALREEFEHLVDYDNLPEEMKQALVPKFEDLENAVRELNAGSNVFSFFKSIQDIFDMQAKYRQERKETSDKLESAQNRKGELQEEKQYLELQGFDTTAIDNELLSTEALIIQLIQRLEELDDKFGKDTKNALDLADKKLGTFRDDLEKMANLVTDTVRAFKAFSNTLNKVYDVMNDGENPEWMQELDSFLGDFLEAFENVLAPIFAVITAISSLIIVIGMFNTMVNATTVSIATLETFLTPLLIIAAAIIALAAIIAGIVAAVQAHDKRLQKEIEDLDKHINTLENSMKNLNDMAERMTGWEKFATSLESVSLGFDKAMKSLMQYVHEMEMHNADLEAAEKYYQNFTETLNEFFNSFKDMQDEITGSVDDWASAIADSLRNAFQSGENAARSLRDTVKEMIGDMINNLITITYIQPMVEKAFEEFMGANTETLALAAKADPKWYTNYIQKRLIDEGALKALEASMMEIADIGTNLSETLGSAFDYWIYNSELSSLSGGIENITEDTARRLEALSNSQLGEVILIRKAVESMGGTFDGTSITSIQAEAVRMNSTLTAMLAMSTAIHQILDDSRLGTRTLKVSIQ